jgi:hypothetical protein
MGPIQWRTSIPHMSGYLTNTQPMTECSIRIERNVGGMSKTRPFQTMVRIAAWRTKGLDKSLLGITRSKIHVHERSRLALRDWHTWLAGSNQIGI